MISQRRVNYLILKRSNTAIFFLVKHEIKPTKPPRVFKKAIALNIDIPGDDEETLFNQQQSKPANINSTASHESSNNTDSNLNFQLSTSRSLQSPNLDSVKTNNGLAIQSTDANSLHKHSDVVV